jgi:hypothetical protein
VNVLHTHLLRHPVPQARARDRWRNCSIDDAAIALAAVIWMSATRPAQARRDHVPRVGTGDRHPSRWDAPAQEVERCSPRPITARNDRVHRNRITAPVSTGEPVARYVELTKLFQAAHQGKAFTPPITRAACGSRC